MAYKAASASCSDGLLGVSAAPGRRRIVMHGFLRGTPELRLLGIARRRTGSWT